jgi:hypothetical protein
MKKTPLFIITLAGSAFLALPAFAQVPSIPEVPVTDAPPTVDVPPTPERPAPERSLIPQEIHDARAELAALRAELAQSRAELMRSLGSEATREEIVEALRAWNSEHAETIGNARELAAELAAFMRENRPERPVAPGGPDAVAERRNEFRERAQVMAAQRSALREQMKDATAEEREELIREFREAQTLLMQERREERRQDRAPDGNVGGERRPGG